MLPFKCIKHGPTFLAIISSAQNLKYVETCLQKLMFSMIL